MYIYTFTVYITYCSNFLMSPLDLIKQHEFHCIINILNESVVYL